MAFTRMLKFCLRNYWLTGAVTAAAIATATVTAYAALDSPTSSPVQKSNHKGKVKNKLSGLANEGNTCFINATVQALASCQLFVQWIDSVIGTLWEFHPLQTTISLHTTVTVLNNQHPSIQADPYSARQLVQTLENHGRWILRSDEQDAHEFFNLLFTKIDEEVNLKKNNELDGIAVSVDENTTDNGLLPRSGKSQISSPFRGHLASQLICLLCGHKASVRYDVFECLSIPLPKLDIKTAFNMLTVESLLKSFLAAETVGEVQCDNCSVKKPGMKNVFLKQLSIGKLPQCLCLHIQRCDWTTGQLTKRQDLVKFEEELNVGSYVYTHRLTGNLKPVRYRLKAVVEHLGVVDSGHFVTFRQNATADGRVKWFYTSDTYVRSACIDEVLKSSPYMLFYERCK